MRNLCGAPYAPASTSSRTLAGRRVQMTENSATIPSTVNNNQPTGSVGLTGAVSVPAMITLVLMHVVVAGILIIGLAPTRDPADRS